MGKDNEITVRARVENLPTVLQFVTDRLQEEDWPIKAQMQIEVAIEEIFVNIASYAYPPGEGVAQVRVDISEDPPEAVITFTDRGVPYDPLRKEDPDVTLSAEKRKIGGLGIFMAKRSMDDMQYEYKDGCNILTLKKSLPAK